jgi:hypothetical protein
MFDKLLEVVNSKHFIGLIAFLNGWFCFVNASHGAWGWAALSGFFCWLMVHQYCKRD